MAKTLPEIPTAVVFKFNLIVPLSVAVTVWFKVMEILMVLPILSGRHLAYKAGASVVYSA